MVCEDVCPTYTVDKEFLIQAADICEALTNLTYLIRMDSGEPGRVQSYVEMAEERTHALGTLLHAIAGADREHA
jgi:enoyl-[acyl-carrier-protein] reductase (NADH)